MYIIGVNKRRLAPLAKCLQLVRGCLSRCSSDNLIHGIHGYVWLEAEPNEIQMPSELLSFIDSSIEFGHGGARLQG